MKTHLRFWCVSAYKVWGVDDAVSVMAYLGITYQHCTNARVGDQWWFWNCENVPEELPPYLEVIEKSPMDFVGTTLSKEQAEKIIAYERS